MAQRIIINGLDLIDITKIIFKKKGRYLALLLGDLEQIIYDERQYKLVRKLVLDTVNDLVRSIIRIILPGGEIEGEWSYNAREDN